MFLGTFWEHHTCLYIYHALIIKYLNTILCYSEEIIQFWMEFPQISFSNIFELILIVHHDNCFDLVSIQDQSGRSCDGNISTRQVLLAVQVDLPIFANHYPILFGKVNARLIPVAIISN